MEAIDLKNYEKMLREISETQLHKGNFGTMYLRNIKNLIFISKCFYT